MLCKICGNEIEFRADRPNRIHCSNECRMTSFRVEIECDECGKVFEEFKNKIGKNIFHFCCMDCKKKSKKLAEYLSEAIKNSEKYKEARANQNRVYVKGVHNSPSTEFKKGWQNTEKGKEIIKKRAKSLTNGLSKPEKFFIDVIKENNLPFKFVGDGKFIIDTKNPDFIYTEKGNKIIEVFSDYWHREDVVKYWHQTEEGTKQYYGDRGYNVLVIWQRELKKENIKNILKRIDKFLKGTLEIENIPTKTYKEFLDFAEQDFCGERGMTLKYVWDNFKMWQIFFQNMDMKLDLVLERISQVGNKEESPGETIHFLSGRTVLKGGKTK